MYKKEGWCMDLFFCRSRLTRWSLATGGMVGLARLILWREWIYNGFIWNWRQPMPTTEETQHYSQFNFLLQLKLLRHDELWQHLLITFPVIANLTHSSIYLFYKKRHLQMIIMHILCTLYSVVERLVYPSSHLSYLKKFTLIRYERDFCMSVAIWLL